MNTPPQSPSFAPTTAKSTSCLLCFSNSQTTQAPIERNVPYRCTDANAVLCDNNRLDVREGKIFFQVPVQSTVFVSKLTPISNALFRSFPLSFEVPKPQRAKA
ncbi:MAG: hypothetical protein H6728_01510 [Myxococcales bacterium]|nr:hypothetical protein [Myxococcales bacterium]